MKDLEASHLVKIDAKQAEVDSMKIQIYEVNRQLDVLNDQLETQKQDADKNVQVLKD